MNTVNVPCKVQWRTTVSVVMNIRVVFNTVVFFFVTVRLLPSCEGVCLGDVRGSGKKLQSW